MALNLFHEPLPSETAAPVYRGFLDKVSVWEDSTWVTFNPKPDDYITVPVFDPTGVDLQEATQVVQEAFPSIFSKFGILSKGVLVSLACEALAHKQFVAALKSRPYDNIVIVTVAGLHDQVPVRFGLIAMPGGNEVPFRKGHPNYPWVENAIKEAGRP